MKHEQVEVNRVSMNVFCRYKLKEPYDGFLKTMFSHVVEVLAGYSNRASFKIDKLNIIRDAFDRIDAAELRRPPVKKPRPAQRYRLADRFTAEELDQLVTRYKAGETSTALARESGITKSTFLRLLAERGVGTRPRGLTPAKEGEILRLRKQGMIIREIAKRVGSSYEVVRIFLLSQDKS